MRELNLIDLARFGWYLKTSLLQQTSSVEGMQRKLAI